MSVFVDNGYRTRLGVSFYDRVAELGNLEELTGSYRLVVVYGPRNVGKSELVYYWGRRRHRHRFVAVQSDLLRASERVEGVARYLVAPGDEIRESILEALRSRLRDLGLLGLVYAAYDVIHSLLGETIFFIDEFHLLPRYSGRRAGLEEALVDLEALAHSLAKAEEPRLRVVLAVSEGFFASQEALTRLHGYSTEYLLVEHMDKESYRALYTEYAEGKGCSTDFATIYGVTGGAPGYLAELCSSQQAVERLIERSESLLEWSLAEAREALGLGAREAIELSYRLLGGELVSPLEQPKLHRLGQLLVLHNIAYPAPGTNGTRYRPQLPIYRVILEIAAEEKQATLLGISTKKALRRAREQVETNKA